MVRSFLLRTRDAMCRDSGCSPICPSRLKFQKSDPEASTGYELQPNKPDPNRLFQKAISKSGPTQVNSSISAVMALAIKTRVGRRCGMFSGVIVMRGEAMVFSDSFDAIFFGRNALSGH